MSLRDEDNMSQLGKIMKAGRDALGLDVHEVAQRTRIRAYYIRAIEEGRFHVIPAAFDTAYVKLYAQLLGIDPKYALALYREETGTTLKR